MKLYKILYTLIRRWRIYRGPIRLRPPTPLDDGLTLSLMVFLICANVDRSTVKHGRPIHNIPNDCH